MTDDWSVLRLEVAGLAAIEAIVIAVLHQADVVLALAEAAEAGAAAVLLYLIALHANEFVGHAGKLYREDRQLAIGRSRFSPQNSARRRSAGSFRVENVFVLSVAHNKRWFWPSSHHKLKPIATRRNRQK